MDDLIELRAKKAALEEELETVESALGGAESEEASGTDSAAEKEALASVRQEILEGLQLIDATIRHIIHSLAQDANLPGEGEDGNTFARGEEGEEGQEEEEEEEGDKDKDKDKGTGTDTDTDTDKGRAFVAEDLREGDFCSTLFEGQIRNALVAARPTLHPAFSVDVVIVGVGTRTQVAQVQPPRRPAAAQLHDGAVVRAAYSQDWLFYAARILRRLPDGRLLVHYVDYANEEPVSVYAIDPQPPTRSPAPDRPAPLRRDRKTNSEQAVKVAAWHSFASKSASAKRTGFLTGRVHKESIFRSPDSVDGKVGVTGSGKGMTHFHAREKYLFRPSGTDE